MHLLRVEEDIHELSLYAGQGFGSYILSGKVLESQFTKLSSAVLDRLNQARLQGIADVRTYTYLSLRPRMLSFAEVIPAPRTDGRPESGSVPKSESELLLELGESQTLEVKASAFTDIGNLFAGSGRATSHGNDQFFSGIARSLVSFLNGQEQGDVIVGAIEAERFRPDTSMRTCGLLLRHHLE